MDTGLFQIHWLFTDFKANLDFHWLLTKFTDFSLTLVPFEKPFPWPLTTLWHSGVGSFTWLPGLLNSVGSGVVWVTGLFSLCCETVYSRVEIAWAIMDKYLNWSKIHHMGRMFPLTSLPCIIQELTVMISKLVSSLFPRAEQNNNALSRHLPTDSHFLLWRTSLKESRLLSGGRSVLSFWIDLSRDSCRMYEYNLGCYLETMWTHIFL